MGIRETFVNRSDKCLERENQKISTTDCLMSALAIHNYKWPSLLQYDKSRKKHTVLRNLERLYAIKQTPCDTYMRERLDPVEPDCLRPAYKKIFSTIQRANLLKPYEFLDGSYLLSIDGTGQYSSKNVSCANCCEKHHRNGTTTFYHQLLGAVIVHPEQRVVIPLAPEPILKGDGYKKNDCERSAAKRLLEKTRREHPHLKLTVVEDGLASNAPHIWELERLNMHYILGVKPGDHKFLFDWVSHSKTHQFEMVDEKCVKHHFNFINGAPLNDANFKLPINFLEYDEIHPSGKVQHFSWVTDFILTEENVYQIMKGGRARWKIENETFNTLKNQGYSFEHNFGHGKKNLFTVMSMLMMLAFLIDQTQMLASPLFQKARKEAGTWKVLWEDMKSTLKTFLIDSWEQLFEWIANLGHGPPMSIS